MVQCLLKCIIFLCTTWGRCTPNARLEPLPPRSSRSTRSSKWQLSHTTCSRRPQPPQSHCCQRLLSSSTTSGWRQWWRESEQGRQADTSSRKHNWNREGRHHDGLYNKVCDASTLKHKLSKWSKKSLKLLTLTLTSGAVSCCMFPWHEQGNLESFRRDEEVLNQSSTQ